jgi:hypothetical protein
VQALLGGVLTAAMLEHLPSEQSEWLLAHLAACTPKPLDPAGGSSADDSSPVAAQTTIDQHMALTDFLVGATASGEQLSSQHFGCLAQHCKVQAARAAACGMKDRHMSWWLSHGSHKALPAASSNTMTFTCWCVTHF